MKVANNVLELVGSTPMIKLSKVARGIEAAVFAKVEFLNPSGSVKERIAVSMIEAAEREGILKSDSVIVERKMEELFPFVDRVIVMNMFT